MLISRQNGREAFAVLKPQISAIQKSGDLELELEGVITFSPSWGDEFITPLFKQFGERLSLLNTENPSVKATLELLKIPF